MNKSNVYIQVSEIGGKGQLMIDGRLDLLQELVRMFHADEAEKPTPQTRPIYDNPYKFWYCMECELDDLTLADVGHGTPHETHHMMPSLGTKNSGS